MTVYLGCLVIVVVKSLIDLAQQLATIDKEASIKEVQDLQVALV